MNRTVPRSRLAALTVCLMCVTSLAPSLVRGHTQVSQANIEIISETAEELVVKFTNAGGASLTVTFVPENDEGHTFWKPTAKIQQTRGIVFGSGSPELPNSVRLRDRGIDPGDVVQEFTSSIATETFDDLTVYQSYHGEVAIALHNQGMVTSIYYAGLWVPLIVRAPPLPPNWLCERWKSGCCREKWVPDDPDDPDGPGEWVPTPYLPACESGHENCGPTYQSDICDCLKAACNGGDEDVHFAACNTWWCLCNEQSDCDEEVKITALLRVMGDMVSQR